MVFIFLKKKNERYFKNLKNLSRLKILDIK